ncbi:tetratricopeptide repeat protein [bacterium]|nr:tetratricopeptide repeat protein [bacterium]
MKSCLVKCQAKGKQRPALALLLCLAVGIAYAAVISPVAAAQATQFSRPSQGADATAWFAFGLSLYEQKDYRGAKEAFEQVLLRDPQHQKAFEWLSRTQSKLWSNPAVENPPMALNVVAQADAPEGPYAAPTAREEEKARQQRIEQLFKAATALFKDKKYLDAQIKLNQLLEIDPDNRDARELAGKVSEALARVPSGDAPTGAAREAEARAKAEREAAEKGAREEAARRKAAEEEARKLAEAKAKEEEAAAKARAEEEERQARTAEARRVAEQKAAEEAARAAVKTEQTAPPAVLVQPPIPAPAEANVEDYLKRAEQFAEFGNWESAAMNYREALRLSPRNERARRGLAKAEAELARAAAATGEADVRARAAELVQRGETLLRARNYAEAEAAFQQAHTLDPSNKDAAAGLREVAKRLGQEEKSAAAVQAKAQADKVKAELALAEAHKKKGEFAQAEAAYQRVLALDPTTGDAKNGLSKLAEDRKKAQEKTAAEASKVAAEAQAQLARSAQSLVDEGRALKDAGDLVGAVKKWQEAARLDADNELAKRLPKRAGAAEPATTRHESRGAAPESAQ